MKIGICHYRIGKTDGVSLEIIKRDKILQDMGHEIKLISGPRNLNANYVIPELEFENENVRQIKENAFHELKDFRSQEELMSAANKIAASIERQFLEIHEIEQFDALFLHNIFSHVLHIPAARAFYEFTLRTKLPIIGVHHDFWWDGTNVQRYQPTGEAVRAFLEKYVPPRQPNIYHVTINSLNQKILKEKHNISSIVVPDTFDFEQPAWEKDEYNQSLPQDIDVKENDVLVLQATRIVDRKAIELAIDFVAKLAQRKSELIGKTLYNGKKITKDSEIVLVLAGYTEDFAQEYRERLEKHIQRTGISVRFIDDCVNTWRIQHDGKKFYSLWDTYVHADIVTYPSIWEGWGNQFIEAVFAKKPIVVYEYPVFKTDIKPEGYSVISLGDTLGHDRPDRLVTVPENHIETAASGAIQTLLNSNTSEVLEENFKIGQENHNNGILRQRIEEILAKIGR